MVVVVVKKTQRGFDEVVVVVVDGCED